jgi:hypothetical protein
MQSCLFTDADRPTFHPSYGEWYSKRFAEVRKHSLERISKDSPFSRYDRQLRLIAGVTRGW